ncbi:MAG: zinc ABC transporter ATP-binding protein AztA [Rhodoferax sp.]
MITLDNLTVSYRQHPALHHVSAFIARNSLTAVIGPNGSGKSTLLKTLMGLIHPAGGKVRLAVPAQRVAYLPQVAEIERDFPMTVRDCVLLGAWSQIGPWGGVDAAVLARAHQALHAVGLEGFEQRAIGSLSSGQFQRVLFARLMLQDAELILLDEPFTALDSRTTAALLALIHDWHAQGRTVVAVLHDDAQVLEHFEHSLLLARECVACGPTPQVLTPANLARARALAEAWDDHAALCARDAQPA